MRSVVILGKTGCLLFSLIIINLFFGLFFLKPLIWLLVEVVLVLIFTLSISLFSRKVFSSFSRQKNKNVIDVEAQVVNPDAKRMTHGQ